jgi:hypothetical protein
MCRSKFSLPQDYLEASGQLHAVTVQIRYLGILVIHIVEEIELLPLPSNHLFMTSLITIVG